MTYEAIAQTQAEFAVARQCAVLGVSESGYYAWRKRPVSRRQQADEALKATLYARWQASRGLYGAPRLYADIKAEGLGGGRHRVARLMRELGIQGKMARKRRPRTTQADPSHQPAPNGLNRQFKASRPNQVWLTDITYIETAEGYLYLAGVLDLFSRQIVGLAMTDHLRSELVEGALDMALQQRHPPEGLLHHSDRGSQYTSETYQHKLAKAKSIVSMSRTANCLDNAPMESFWATLKRECAATVFASHTHARTAIFSYIMGFYNRQRRHSALDYLSPFDFESHHQRDPHTPLN